MKDGTKRLALLGLLLAAAVLLGYVEAMIPLPIPVPGIKLGLANCLVLFVLFRFGFREALLITLLRTVIVALLFTSLPMLLYSAGGALGSIFLMALLKKGDVFSVYGLSVAGAAVHNGIQIAIALAVLFGDGASHAIVFVYLPLLLLAAVPTGLLNAAFSVLLQKRIRE
ncbi:MAG: Gx transporter family protein [Lachnospiraceae bacterium]|nr:Gx transporter family protein [Lachnospiraceae bacterium]